MINHNLLVVVILLLILHKMATQHYIELEKNGESQEKIEFWKKANKRFIHVAVVIVLLGFIHNIYVKHNQYGKQFSIVKHIFQNKKC